MGEAMTPSSLSAPAASHVVVVVVMAVSLVVLGACGGEAVRSKPSDPVFFGVCAARQAAAKNDLAGARRIFFDQVHQGVHQMAAALGTNHRAAAGRLLEAKQAVESDFQASSDHLGADLDVLLEAVSDGVAATGADRPASCKVDKT